MKKTITVTFDIPADIADLPTVPHSERERLQALAKVRQLMAVYASLLDNPEHGLYVVELALKQSIINIPFDAWSLSHLEKAEYRLTSWIAGIAPHVLQHKAPYSRREAMAKRQSNARRKKHHLVEALLKTYVATFEDYNAAYNSVMTTLKNHINKAPSEVWSLYDLDKAESLLNSMIDARQATQAGKAKRIESIRLS